MYIQPSKIGRIHFIGIGGIGMSGIAKVLANLGFAISGSDLGENIHTRTLCESGALIFTGHEASHVVGASVVVVSSAIKPDNPELCYAKEMSIPIVQRAEMLSELMRMKQSIAISGTHGKTTTTSLMACLMDKAGFDPTVVNGGVINAYGSNARIGLGEWIVVEADESDGSFTKLFPTIAVVTNINPEHMDHYKTEDNLKASFHKFIHNIPFYGLAILCLDHLEIEAMVSKGIERRFVTYGFHEHAHIRATNVRWQTDGMLFDVVINRSHYHEPNVLDFQQKLTDLFLPMHGEHNVQNSLTLVAVAQELGLSQEVLREGLSKFQGVKRRFTNVGSTHGITFIDDYAHHPIEIKAVLKTAHAVQQETTRGKVIVVMQPHRYSRLVDLMDDFASVLKNTDYLFIAPVYGAGEAPIDGVTSEELIKRLKALGHPFVYAVNKKEDLAIGLASVARTNDLIIGMGAGNITSWMADLPVEMENLLSETCSPVEKNLAVSL